MTQKKFNVHPKRPADIDHTFGIIQLNFDDLYANVMFESVYDAGVDGIIDTGAGGLGIDLSGVLKGSIIVCNAVGVFSLLQSSTENYVPSVQADGTIAWGVAVPAINEVGDVTITGLGDGEVLMSSSGVWINRTLAEASIASTAHGSTHERAGSDQVDGDHLDVDWNPTNYTPATTPAEADNVDDLTAHLYGIDQALAGAVSHTLDSATHSDVGAITETRGMLLMRGASAWGGLTAGTSGYYLKSQGAGSDLVWGTVSGGDADTLDGYEGADYRDKPGITVGAEAANTIMVDVSMETLAGVGQDELYVFRAWLSDSAGGGVTGTLPDSNSTWTTGTEIDVIVFGKHWIVLTNATGDATLDIQDTGAPTWYLNVEVDGKVYTSAAITFAA